MSPRIILTVTEGELKGREFLFGDHTLCTVGRSRDCLLQLPNDVGHVMVSRHHCLLDVDPPTIRIRDLGSLNGTYVNGERIGQRGKVLQPEEAALVDWPERELHDGDEVRIGNTVLRVGVYVPMAATRPKMDDRMEVCPRECATCC
jgi:pSer/pThr/pTyr-binding forkhead associated (FHA) protein